MTKYFNTEGSCNPKEHYMVQLNDRSKTIKKLLIDRKKYFIINRGRQYGKTTTLDALRRELKEEYIVEEYEADYHTQMDIQAVAEEIYAYTSGYPVLVSSICKQLDEKLETMKQVWTTEGIAAAVKMILKKSSPLFEHMTKQLDMYEDLHNMIEDILYRGKKITYSPEQKSISLGVMFGFLKEENGHVAIANRMFEMCLLNLFTAEASGSDVYSQGGSDRNGFIKNDGRHCGLSWRAVYC